MDTYQAAMAPHFRNLLVQHAARLGECLQHELAAVHGAAGREVADFKDFAAAQAAADVEEVQAGQAAATLQQVRAALRRVNDGTYGECLDCGDHIDLRRLIAVPVAAYCAACQSMHERRR